MVGAVFHLRALACCALSRPDGGVGGKRFIDRLRVARGADRGLNPPLQLVRLFFNAKKIESARFRAAAAL